MRLSGFVPYSDVGLPVCPCSPGRFSRDPALTLAGTLTTLFNMTMPLNYTADFYYRAPRPTGSPGEIKR